jgi:FAD/FMN-containing dehydrogenase
VAGRAVTEGGLMIDLSLMRDVEVDADAGTARAQGGATWGDVDRATQRHGLAVTGGMISSTGIGGLTLGGGLGWLSRAHGLAAGGVRAVEVVTADGEARRVDASHEPDLFWALRGGGGRFAIVTALELALHPIGEVTAGMVAWPAEHAGEVLEQARRWAVDAPECASVVVRVLSLPPIEAIPEPIRGRRIVTVIAAHVGPAADAERLLAPLRGGDVLLDGFGPVGPADLVRVAGDPEDPGPARGHGLLLDTLTPDAVAALAELAGDERLSVLELRQLGGAVARPAPAGGALTAIDAGWAVFAGGIASAALTAALDDVRARLAPFAAPRALLSSCGGGIDPATGFDAATWGRMLDVRDAYDPDRLILAHHDGR